MPLIVHMSVFATWFILSQEVTRELPAMVGATVACVGSTEGIVEGAGVGREDGAKEFIGVGAVFLKEGVSECAANLAGHVGSISPEHEHTVPAANVHFPLSSTIHLSVGRAFAGVGTNDTTRLRQDFTSHCMTQHTHIPVLLSTIYT